MTSCFVVWYADGQVPGATLEMLQGALTSAQYSTASPSRSFGDMAEWLTERSESRCECGPAPLLCQAG